MNNLNNRSVPPLTELLASIRARVEAQLPRRGFVTSFPGTEGAINIERWCDVHELLKYEDEEFINEAYHRLFGRKPDADGREYYLSCIRTHTFTKEEVLRDLAESEEARSKNVRILGLTASVDLLNGEIHDQASFVRTICRQYFGKDPAAASVRRWTTLLDRGMITREDITMLFSRRSQRGSRSHSLAGLPVDVQKISSLLSEMRQQLSYQQRVINNLLSRNI
jgi:hypothetical protein